MAMGLGGLGGLGGSQSRINVTPLIDVLLVLLILFIVVAPVLTRAMQSEIPIRSDEPLPPDQAESQWVIRLRADGRLLLNREEIGPSDLPDRLREAFARQGGERAVFLDADAGVLYGAVIEVMDLCRDGGAEVIGAVPDSIGAGA